MSKSEDSVQQELIRCRKIISNMRDAIIIIGVDGKFLFISPQLAPMLGRTTIGATLDSVTDLIHPEDLPMLLDNFQKSVVKQKPSVTNPIIFRALHKNGHYIWLEGSTQCYLNESNQLIGFITVLRDITDRKHAEQRLKESEEMFRTISEQSLIGIYILQDGQLKYINNAGSKLVETSPEELMNIPASPLLQYIHPKDRDSLLQQTLLKQMECLEGLLNYAFRIITKSGKIRWLETFFKTIQYQGRPADLILAIDITDAKEAELARVKLLEEIKRQNDELNELARVKNEFFTDISHELRTPLTVIKGYTELLLQSSGLNPQDREDLERIQQNELKLERLVDELIEYTRLELKSIQFNDESFRLSEILPEIIKELSPLLQEKQLVVSASLGPDEFLHLDRFQISKVIKNLLENAIKYSFPHGKIFMNSKINSGAWTFSIKDQGIGIAPQELSKLFTRFTRLKNGQTFNKKGIGIGLALCKKIIDAYNGKIWAESEGLNKGATFTFNIPLSSKNESKN
ncbi:MAG: PAS domain-containing sensor histidine kinase [Candidatus Helarchaeota archaeon]